MKTPFFKSPTRIDKYGKISTINHVLLMSTNDPRYNLSEDTINKIKELLLSDPNILSNTLVDQIMKLSFENSELNYQKAFDLLITCLLLSCPPPSDILEVLHKIIDTDATVVLAESDKKSEFAINFAKQFTQSIELLTKNKVDFTFENCESNAAIIFSFLSDQSEDTSCSTTSTSPRLSPETAAETAETSAHITPVKEIIYKDETATKEILAALNIARIKYIPENDFLDVANILNGVVDPRLLLRANNGNYSENSIIKPFFFWMLNAIILCTGKISSQQITKILEHSVMQDPEKRTKFAKLLIASIIRLYNYEYETIDKQKVAAILLQIQKILPDSVNILSSLYLCPTQKDKIFRKKLDELGDFILKNHPHKMVKYLNKPCKEYNYCETVAALRADRRDFFKEILDAEKKDFAGLIDSIEAYGAELIKSDKACAADKTMSGPAPFWEEQLAYAENRENIENLRHFTAPK